MFAMPEITHDNLPQAVAQLSTKFDTGFDELKRLILERNAFQQTEQDHWMDLNELVIYDPEKRSKMTFYGYIRRREIPFHKTGKKVIFLKSEIDTWLKQGRQKTHTEISAEAENYLTDTPKNKARSAS
jgi:excisionase family DNA binding protein